MLPEPLVLDGDDRVLQHLGNVVGIDTSTVWSNPSEQRDLAAGRVDQAFDGSAVMRPPLLRHLDRAAAVPCTNVVTATAPATGGTTMTAARASAARIRSPHRHGPDRSLPSVLPIGRLLTVRGRVRRGVWARSVGAVGGIGADRRLRCRG